MFAFMDWLLTPERVAIHQPSGTAVVADLHLGYNEARRRSGEAVPLFDMDHHLGPLARAMFRHEVRRLVLAGDIVEEALDDGLVSTLERWLTRSKVELAGVVPGNHDRAIARFAGRLLFQVEGVRLGAWHVVHGDRDGDARSVPTVQGHLHPGVRWGGRLCPCYLAAKERLILPAYSLDAKGIDFRKLANLRGYRSIAIVAGRRLIEVVDGRIMKH